MRSDSAWDAGVGSQTEEARHKGGALLDLLGSRSAPRRESSGDNLPGHVGKVLQTDAMKGLRVSSRNGSRPGCDPGQCGRAYRPTVHTVHA